MPLTDLRRHSPTISTLAACCALLFAAATAAQANPKNVPAGAKLVYSFNVIGYPEGQSYDGNCGNGHRIFVNREANNARVLVTNSTTDWDIVDCNATADHQAELATNQAGIYDIYVRILGKPGGHINICADTLADVLNGEILCQVGTLDLTRHKGQSKFTLAPNAIFDASNVELLWTVDTNADYRIAQFRVYTRP